MSRKTSPTNDAQERNTEIALFRYGLISALLFDPLAAGQLEQALRAIAAKTYTIPYSSRTRVSVSSLRRYLQLYNQGGFEALRSSPRSDKGLPRAFPPEILERAIALREEQPARTTSTLVDILKREADLQLEHPLNAHTLTSQLRRRGKTRRLLSQESRTYQRFEREHTNSLWQGDMLVGPWLPDPYTPGKKRRAYLYCFLDDHSRLVPYAEFFSTKPCRAWNGCSRSGSCAGGCQKHCTSTMAKFTQPLNLGRLAPAWASNAFTPPHIVLREKENRNDFF